MSIKPTGMQTSIFLWLCVIGLLGGVWFPLQKQKQKVEKNLFDLRQATQKTGKNIEEFGHIKKNYYLEQEKLVRLEGELVPPKDVVMWLKDIEERLDGSGLVILAMEPELSEEALYGNVRCFRVDINIEGKYEQLGSFLEDMRESARYFQVGQLALRNSPENTDLIEAHVALECYERSY